MIDNIMDTDDRAAVVCVGGADYRLILTTKATKEIAKRYGGLEKLGDKLLQSENFEMALDEVVWLLVLLANQSILIHNLQNPGAKRDLLTAEVLELLTSPHDLTDYKDAIMEAMQRGTQRFVVSEDGGRLPEADGKNAKAG
jgi:hypothetical protein